MRTLGRRSGRTIMFEGTELLSYALFLFLAYVYLPYTFFKFGAERSIDLGKRRDFTQLEEIISGFAPAAILHLMSWLIYLGVNRLRGVQYSIDFSVMASMFGSNRGAVSDYIYAGSWWGCIEYVAMILWPMAMLNGWWFGRAVRAVAQDPRAVHGINELWGEKKPKEFFPWQLRPAWWIWYAFFHESIVPLYSWTASRPVVRVTTKEGDVFDGRFVCYEKTTDGQFDAIRLAFSVGRRADPNVEIGTLYIKWARIANVIVMDDLSDKQVVKALKEARDKRDKIVESWLAAQ